MRSYLLILIGVVLTLLNAPSQVPAADVTFSQKPGKELLERASKTKVYQLVPPRLDDRTVSDRVFGPRAKSQRIAVGTMLARSFPDQPSNFMILDRKNGFLSFSLGMADVLDDKPGRLLNEEEAVKVARDYLTKIGFAPRDEKEIVLGHISRVKSASFDPSTGREGAVRDQMLVVHFARQIDAIRVVGPGSKMIVRLADEGQVVGGAVRWSELGEPTDVKPFQLRQPEQIVEDVSSFLSGEHREARNVEVVNTELYYYDRGGGYLQPVVGYEAVISSGEFKQQYFGQTALLVNPPETVGPLPIPREARTLIQKGGPDLKRFQRVDD